MKTAVFLGAGASKAFGYPLTSELLERILQRLFAGKLFDASNPERVNSRDRKWFREHLLKFLPGIADVWKRCAAAAPGTAQLGVSITDLLSLADRALNHAEGRAGLAPEDLGRFRFLLERATYEAIVRGGEQNKKTSGDSSLQFARWMQRKPKPMSILTTNYDNAVDRRVIEMVGGPDESNWDACVAGAVDFGFAWRHPRTGQLIPRPARADWQLFKLHGSMSWLRCCVCGQLYQNISGSIISKAFTEKLDEWNTCHCNDWSRLRMHLVTPSLIRTNQDPHLLGIWQAGLEALRTSEHWVIIGYSLPPEDVSIRSLFLRAWDGHFSRKKLRVTVVQRENVQTENIYRAFFPAKQLSYHRQGLVSFLDGETGK